MKTSTYPENINKERFYVEYIEHEHTGGNVEIWRLFERNYVGDMEGHPFQLANGWIVNNISINNKKYLKLIVDGMNMQFDMDSELRSNIC